MRRQPVTALFVFATLSAAGCGSSSHATKGPPQTAPTTAERTTTQVHRTQQGVVEQSLCPSTQEPGIQASFGRLRSTTAADALVRKAAGAGFQGLIVQQRGCNDYAVVLPGLKNLRQAKDFRVEARSVGFRVTVECRSHRIEGGLAAVFGHRRTRRQALVLRRQAERVGFMNLQVQQDQCNDWEIDLYGLKTRQQRRDFTKEAARAGFRVAFEPG